MSAQEFQTLSKQASSYASVTDFIPLAEVVRVEVDIQPKDSEEQAHDADADERQAEAGAELEVHQRGGLAARLTSSIERCTGLDLNGDGRVNHSIPEYDKHTHEVHLLVLTEEGGL